MIRESSKTSQKRFDTKKDSILLTFTHRFLQCDDPAWSLLKEKLVFLYRIYKKKDAVKLCSCCLSILTKHKKSQHSEITLSSIFFNWDPEIKTRTEIAELFKKHGRTTINSDGSLLIGFPGFGLDCSQHYRYLQGSQIGDSNTTERIDNISKTNALPVTETQPYLQKRVLMIDRQSSTDDDQMKVLRKHTKKVVHNKVVHNKVIHNKVVHKKRWTTPIKAKIPEKLSPVKDRLLFKKVQSKYLKSNSKHNAN